MHDSCASTLCHLMHRISVALNRYDKRRKPHSIRIWIVLYNFDKCMDIKLLNKEFREIRNIDRCHSVQCAVCSVHSPFSIAVVIEAHQIVVAAEADIIYWNNDWIKNASNWLQFVTFRINSNSSTCQIHILHACHFLF